MDKDNKRLSLAIDIIAIVVAILSLGVSLYTYFDNKADTKLYDKINSMNNQLENLEAIEITSNLDYWDYSIDQIIFELHNEYEYSEELWQVTAFVRSKQAGAALDYINKIPAPLSNDNRLPLLKCCLYLREIILNNKCLSDYAIVNADDLRLIYLQAYEQTNSPQHTLIFAIIEYYLNDLVSSADHLQSVLGMLNSDSPFYDVANYWLALISIRVRSPLCDIDSFLNSSYQDETFTRVMKSSLSILFKSGFAINGSTYHGRYPANIPVYSIVENEQEYQYVFKASVLNDNPARYLLPDNPENAAGYYSEGYLHDLCDMTYKYGDYLYSLSTLLLSDEDELALINNVNHHNAINSELVKLLDEYMLYPEMNFLDPRVEANFCGPFTYSSIERWGKYSYLTIFPFDIVLEKCLYLSSWRTNYNDEEYGYIYSSLAKMGQYYESDENFFREYGARAVMAVKYHDYMDNSYQIDKYEAALCAYNYGYLYDFIYSALIEYHEQQGSTNMVDQLKKEMNILGHRRT